MRKILEVAAGVRLAVRDAGPREADALVLLHGWASSADFWDDAADRLAATQRVVWFDQRMHGASLALASDVGVEVSIRLLVEDVRAVMDACGLSSAVVVGHSMGGQVAALVAEQCGDSVRGAVLADPAYGADDDEIAAAPERRAAFLTAAAVADVASGLLAPSDPRADARQRALGTLYDSEYLRADSVGAREDTRALLQRRSRPALTIYSSVVGAATERELSAGAAVVPEVEWWDGTTHDFPAEDPERFAARVLRWVGELA